MFDTLTARFLPYIYGSWFSDHILHRDYIAASYLFYTISVYNNAMKLCILLLTCTDEFEAETIAGALLKKRLIVCAKRFKVSSQFLYRKNIHNDDEVLIVMDTVEGNFRKIESEVKKLHSYDTFVLVQLPVSQTTDKVLNWVKSEISI